MTSFAAFLLPLVTGFLLGVAIAAVIMYRRLLSAGIAAQDQQTALIRENADLTARNTALEQRMAAQQDELATLEQRFALQFENLANRIFDEKSKTFRDQNSESLAQILSPLRENLQVFQQKVEDSAKEQFSLKNEIVNIMRLNENMRVQTEKLTNALRGDTKVMGNWGEVVLERILEASGLKRGETYTVQGAGLGLRHVETDGRLQPDVIIHLPEGKNVIVDAKVSLLAYERLTAATDDTERTAAAAAFSQSVKAHIKGLAERRYQDIPELGTPDFVLMFMPIEGAYALAMQADSNLHHHAWENRIVIVGPSTLFATLRTIASVWRLEHQNKNALEIARQGGNLYDKFISFVEDMDSIGSRLNQTRGAYDNALKKLSTGAGNLVKRAEDLRALGIKTTKTMPKNLDYEDAAGEEPPTKTAQLP